MEFIKLKCMACGWEWRMGFPFGACDVIEMGFVKCTCKKCNCWQPISKENAILLTNSPQDTCLAMTHPLDVEPQQ